jgi:L-ascorbate metabolism protein UlaG (beta-lactamase superfamily)
MSEALGTDQPEFTIGREGLKIPTITEAPRDGFAVGHFFRSFWELNEKPVDLVQWSERQPYERELVVPAARLRPLVIINGHYQPTSPVLRQREEDDYRARGAFGGHPGNHVITLGREVHQIKIPPESVGSFVTFLSYDYTDESGTYTGWANHDPVPNVYFEGDLIYSKFSRSDQIQGDSSVSLYKALAKTVELLS